jgi:hypothetical protein
MVQKTEASAAGRSVRACVARESTCNISALVRRASSRLQQKTSLKYLLAGLTHYVAPTEVRCEFLKSRFFVVAVFLWSNRVIIRINMHREATINPHMVPWGWGEGRKKYIFSFTNILRENISI